MLAVMLQIVHGALFLFYLFSRNIIRYNKRKCTFRHQSYPMYIHHFASVNITVQSLLTDSPVKHYIRLSVPVDSQEYCCLGCSPSSFYTAPGYYTIMTIRNTLSLFYEIMPVRRYIWAILTIPLRTCDSFLLFEKQNDVMKLLGGERKIHEFDGNYQTC